jgi:acyl-CoA hydrolase
MAIWSIESTTLSGPASIPIRVSREWRSVFSSPGSEKPDRQFPIKRKVKTPMNNLDPIAPRPVRESQSEMAEFVLPNDANPLGALLGGRLMHWIDLAGAMAAHRHARSYVVTAAVDHIDFLVPVRVGSLIILRSSVNRVFRTSMEIGVKVWVENYIQDKREHVASAHLTFVAVDGKGGRLAVAPVVPETEEQKRRYEDAGRRREVRRAELERRRKSVH